METFEEIENRRMDYDVFVWNDREIGSGRCLGG